MKGNNLPSPKDVISLYKSRKIMKLRLFDPNHDALNALKGSGISVILGTLHKDLKELEDPSFAATWVKTNVAPFVRSVKFNYICAGNEVIPGEFAKSILPAIRNLDTAIKNAGFSIPVTTAVDMAVLEKSYPPSEGAFSKSSIPYMQPILKYLQSKKYPLLINVYPFITYMEDRKNITLDYALFKKREIVVRDGSVVYTNLFDAMIDSVYAAMQKLDAPSVNLVVSETGWPSNGTPDEAASVENARIYNNNVVQHVKKGTPRKPGKEIETYLFAMFNENEKPGPKYERHFGLYKPEDMSEVYRMNF